MEKIYYVIYRRSMLYDKQNKETVCFHVRPDEFSNNINEALFFESFEEVDIILQGYKECQKTYYRKLTFKI